MEGVAALVWFETSLQRTVALIAVKKKLMWLFVGRFAQGPVISPNKEKKHHSQRFSASGAGENTN